MTTIPTIIPRPVIADRFDPLAPTPTSRPGEREIWRVRTSGADAVSGNPQQVYSKSTSATKTLKKRDRFGPKLRVLRRLHGFLVQSEGKESRVVFVQGEEFIHYFLPSKLLHDAGVRVENQPFECDEVETVVEGISMSGFRFRPSANAESSKPTPLPLDEERRAKLAKLLKSKG